MMQHDKGIILDLSKTLELLYSAHHSFSSVKLEWIYQHHVKTLREMLSGANGNTSARRIEDGASPAADEQEWGKTWSRVWWQKPDRFREESGKSEQLKSVLVLNQGRSLMTYPQVGRFFKKAVPTGSSSFFVPERDSSVLPEEYAYRYAMLYPAFLLASHDFQFVELTEHLGREALRVYAAYRTGADVCTQESFFWESPYRYELLVDSERGILLEYALRKDEQIVAVASVKDIVIDEPFDDALFSI